MVTNRGMMVPLDARTLPRILVYPGDEPEASATLKQVDASLRNALASGELEEAMATIDEYGFSPSLTVPVIAMWADQLPECLNNTSTSIILRREST